jgi:hypothetical protein
MMSYVNVNSISYLLELMTLQAQLRSIVLEIFPAATTYVVIKYNYLKSISQIENLFRTCERGLSPDGIVCAMEKSRYKQDAIGRYYFPAGAKDSSLLS